VNPLFGARACCNIHGHGGGLELIVFRSVMRLSEFSAQTLHSFLVGAVSVAYATTVQSPAAVAV